MTDRTCAGCDTSFAPKTGNQIYCTARCRERAKFRRNRATTYDKTLACITCGTELGVHTGTSPRRLCATCKADGFTNDARREQAKPA